MSKKIVPPTLQETERYSKKHDSDPAIVKQLLLWEKNTNPKKKFYFVTEKEDGVLKLYQEPARADEPWLDGIFICFSTSLELSKYIQIIADKTRCGDTSCFKPWSATLTQICDTLLKIVKKDAGVRVELHTIKINGNIDYVDTLWDNITN